MQKRVVIDTDPGLDDALALILALKSPELKVEAITTVTGNAEVDICTKNVFTTLSLLNLGKKIPVVVKGCEKPLKGNPKNSKYIYGKDGLGELFRYFDDGKRRYPEPNLTLNPKPASDFIAELSEEFPNEITLITLGPLTNVATAILKNRQPLKVKEIFMMGGALRVPGNATSVAEFNFFADPEAANIVLNSGIQITMVPLDVTEITIFYTEHFRNLTVTNNTRMLQFIKDASTRAIDYNSKNYGFSGFRLHDPLTVGVTINPQFVVMKELSVDVEAKGGLTRGMSVADFRGLLSSSKTKTNVKACLEVNKDQFLNFFIERLCNLSL